MTIRCRRFLFIIFSLAFVSSVLLGCRKRQPDEPPNTTHQNPNIVVTSTIRQLKQKPQDVALADSTVISGIVVMSDKSGNYYQKIVIEDSTGGIEIEIAQRFLYADFPVNRRVYIRCDSLFLAQKDGMMQLGYLPDANGYVTPIPATMIANHLFPGKFPTYPKPDTVSIEQLAVPEDAQPYLNTLVTIHHVEFVDSDVQRPYALPAEKSEATQRVIRDCRDAVISLETSAHSNFQAITTPSGNGTITALYTNFRGLPQLVIRDTADVHFYGQRCRDLPPIGSRITLLQLRQLYQGTPLTLPDYKIDGVVISDDLYQNIPAERLVIEDTSGAAGITLVFNHSVHYPIGDQLSVSIKNATLSSEYGLMIIKNLTTANVQVTSTNNLIEPLAVSIAQIKANPQSYVSRLVKIAPIYWIGQPTTLNGQSGNLDFSDGSDTMQHFCEQTATFRHQAVISDSASSITGYIFIKNEQPYLKMRNPNPPENDLRP